MDIAREHLPIEPVAGIAADEIGAHRADQRPERPDLRPFTHRIAQRRRAGRDVSDEHIIHIGAVVDDEHDGGVGVDLAQRVAIGKTKPHAVEQPRQPPGHARSDAEIEIGAERRYDLAGVAPGEVHRHFARHAGGLCVLLYGLDHVRIVEQAVDQHLPARQLERADAQLQPGVQLLDGPVGPPPQGPAYARDQQAVEQCPTRQYRHQHKQPDRHRDRAFHWASPVKRDAPALTLLYFALDFTEKRFPPSDLALWPSRLSRAPIAALDQRALFSEDSTG